MELISGRRAASISRADLLPRIARYNRVLLDLGAGDGRYVLDVARRDPGCFAIGVDACREQLRDRSRRAPHNALFVIANALQLPGELDGVASEITVNFPWGSLLRALLDGDRALLEGIERVSRPAARLCVRLNASALAEAGVRLEQGGALVRNALVAGGLQAGRLRMLGAAELRHIPSSWARRMAFGRDPHAIELHGLLQRKRLAA